MQSGVSKQYQTKQLASLGYSMFRRCRVSREMKLYDAADYFNFNDFNGACNCDNGEALNRANTVTCIGKIQIIILTCVRLCGHVCQSLIVF